MNTHPSHPAVLSLREFQSLSRDEQVRVVLEHGTFVQYGNPSTVYRVFDFLVVVQLNDHPIGIAGIQAYPGPSIQ